MYKLYGNIKGWKLLGISKDIHDIVDMVSNEINLHDSIEYLVILSTKEQDFPVFSINNMEDYNVIIKQYGYNKVKARKLR